MPMTNRALIEQLKLAGLADDEAVWAADKVLAAIRATIASGKTVTFEGLGQLHLARSKPYKFNLRPGYLRDERRVGLRYGHVLEVGEPYPDPRYKPSRISTYRSRS